MPRLNGLQTTRHPGGIGAVALAMVMFGCSDNGPQDLPPGADAAAGAGDMAGVSGDLAAPAGLPCAVSSLLQAHCLVCHGQPPKGAPMSLVTYQDLTATSPTMPAQKIAERALARMQDTVSPMPPGTKPTVPQSEIAAFQAWVNAGTPASSCQGTGGDLGISGDLGTAADMGMDPLYDKPVCTSGKTWTSGEHGSPLMHPGRACITCHSLGKGPSLRIAGTVYPTGHEPDDCLGVPAMGDVNIVITDAAGKTFSLPVNANGNFLYTTKMTTIQFPYHAKVTKGGKERAMSATQLTGDCNSCHEQTGVNGAPGRITLPY